MIGPWISRGDRRRYDCEQHREDENAQADPSVGVGGHHTRDVPDEAVAAPQIPKCPTAACRGRDGAWINSVGSPAHSMTTRGSKTPYSRSIRRLSEMIIAEMRKNAACTTG